MRIAASTEVHWYEEISTITSCADITSTHYRRQRPKGRHQIFFCAWWEGYGLLGTCLAQSSALEPVTLTGRVLDPQGAAGDHGEPIAMFIQVGSYLVPNNLSANR
ncbi:MAG TPA: hypothetical protein VEO19_05070 [Terriglobia bacterium]|nr:hypothetical protein [Terriglobia bacterium]